MPFDEQVYRVDGTPSSGANALMLLRHFAVGVGGAIVAAVLWIVVAFILPIAAPFVIARLRGAGGVAGASMSSNAILIAAVVGFLVAFVWNRMRVA